jgi:hypothetical protein
MSLKEELEKFSVSQLKMALQPVGSIPKERVPEKMEIVKQLRTIFNQYGIEKSRWRAVTNRAIVAKELAREPLHDSETEADPESDDDGDALQPVDCELCGEPLLGQPVVVLGGINGCHHVFHNDCLREIDQTSCPICNEGIAKLVPLDPTESGIKDNDELHQRLRSLLGMRRTEKMQTKERQRLIRSEERELRDTLQGERRLIVLRFGPKKLGIRNGSDKPRSIGFLQQTIIPREITESLGDETARLVQEFYERSNLYFQVAVKQLEERLPRLLKQLESVREMVILSLERKEPIKVEIAADPSVHPIGYEVEVYLLFDHLREHISYLAPQDIRQDGIVFKTFT